MNVDRLHHQHTVLIVDDDSRVVRVLSRLMEKDGHAVLTATSGEEALEVLEQERPCLVITDIHMSGIDGFELCRRVKVLPHLQHVPVSLITGQVNEDDAARAEEVGACDYIKKPFDNALLRLRVRNQISLHDALRHLTGLQTTLGAISGSAGDGIIMLDDQGRVTHWNRTAETMFGYSQAEALGVPCHELIAPEQGRHNFAELVPTGSGPAVRKTLDLVARDKQGDELPVEFSFSTASIEGRRVVVGIVRDVSRRVAVERELRASESRFRAVVDNIGVGVAAISTDMKLLTLNRQMREWYPLANPDEHPTCYEALRSPPRQSPCAGCPTRLTLRDGRVHEGITDTPADGGIVHHHIIASPVFDSDGNVTGAIETVEDVTLRVRAERELRASEARLTRLLDALPVGIAIISPDDREVRWVNRAAAALAGYDDTESIIQNSCALLCPAGSGDCPVLDHGMTVDKSERLLLRQDGGQVPVLKSVFEIEFDGEKVLLETFVDIRDRKRLETELGHARKLEAAGQLAAGIAHEINTPAQFIGDSLQFLREAWQDADGAVQVYREAIEVLRQLDGHEELLARIEAADENADWEYLDDNVPDSFDRCFDGIGRIAGIVGAMKEFAHPDQKEKTAADLNRALANTLTIARNEYKYVADLETDFGDIPSVMCHPGAVNQVFLNLIVNAAHAISASVGDSGERGRISIRTRCENGSVRIDIQDSGTGIPERVQDRIFEPFFTTKEVGKGSGQGLAISHSVIVDKHHGFLTFETREGEGTTFTIRLPIGESIS